ncbi:heme o synthase [Pirellulaceae bacterium SH449]
MSTATTISHEQRGGMPITSPVSVPSAAVNSDVRNIPWWKDYGALTKPRITLMILLTVAVAMFAAQQILKTSVGAWVWLHTLVATGMIASSASTLNQWFERERDKLMPRTKRRPLPSGRLTGFEAAAFGWLLVILGGLYLGIMVNVWAMGCGLATWFVYCWVYTPLKPVTWWNTAVGTLPGALPVMIGWTAAGGGPFDSDGWAITWIVILWQFPHFMAIAWLYREQYGNAGFRMITNDEPTGVAAGWHAIIGAVALIPLSIMVLSPVSVLTWGIAALGVISCWSQIVWSWRFLNDRNDKTARKLLRASLVYLPAIMMLIVLRWVLV